MCMYIYIYQPSIGDEGFKPLDFCSILPFFGMDVHPGSDNLIRDGYLE